MDVIKKINKASNIWEILPDLTKEELENAITAAAESYYNSYVTIISDEVYDVLVEKLQSINPKSKALKQIGAPIKGKKVELPYFMGSMNKLKTNDEMVSWSENYPGPYVVSDKLDGISGLLIIDRSKVDLYTRGDGSYGQKISHLVDRINMSLNNKLLNTKTKYAIRGEMIMPKEKFKKYENIMANARNMVAGIVNSKAESLNVDHARDVDFVVYEIIEPRMKTSDQMKLLDKLGFNTAYWDIYEDIDLNILDAVLQKRKKKSIYEIDGIIVTRNTNNSVNNSGNPDFQFAYKGLSETAEVKVISVNWGVSKDGYIVPVIHFEKVRLSGADLENTSGFNAKFIMDHSIGPGAIIKMTRSGDTIPHILGVIKPAKKPSLPDQYDYEWDKNGVNIIDKNADENESVIIKRLARFMRYLGVDNLSEGIVTKLVKNGYDNIPKLISITIEDFMELDGFGEKLANKLYNNLQESLDKLDILTLMVASNAFGRGFGERKIKKILDSYPDIVDKYNKKTHSEWKDKLLSLDGYDTITVDQFLEQLPDFQSFYKKIIKIVPVQAHKKKTKTGGIFKGVTVVFTGFRNPEWKKFIEDQGGKLGSDVSKNTNLLVYNDGEESSNKYKKAKQLNIDTISKSDFAKKYGV